MFIGGLAAEGFGGNGGAHATEAHIHYRGRARRNALASDMLSIGPGHACCRAPMMAARAEWRLAVGISHWLIRKLVFSETPIFSIC